MKKSKLIVIFSWVVLIALADLSYSVNLTGGEETHGAISIAFDDSRRSQYDYAFPLMAERGIPATFYVITDRIRDFSGDDSYMSLAELHTLQDNGCEIGSHSHTHRSFTSLSESGIREQCEMSKEVLQDNGFLVENFAYPYGGRTAFTDSIVADYYRSGRSAYEQPYVMDFPVSDFLVTGAPGETGEPNIMDYLEDLVDEVYLTEGWTIIFFHKVFPDANNVPYTISSQDFESFLDYIISKDVQTITVSEGFQVEDDMDVNISPNLVKMYFGESQTFSASVLGGTPPYTYEWFVNDTLVSVGTGQNWTFSPRANGHYRIYANITDGNNIEVKSNVVGVVDVYSVYLMLNPEPNQATIHKGEQVTVGITILNQFNPVLDSSLVFVVTGPGGYYHVDPYPVSMEADSVWEYCFEWVVPDVSGEYVVEVGLSRALLTAYDVVWINVD